MSIPERYDDVRRPCWILGALVFAASVGFCQSTFADSPIDFNRDIRPILSEHCLHCHGPDESQREADLRLDHRETVIDSVIVAGDPDASEFFQRVIASDPDQQMPPPELEKPLSPGQIKLLSQWISEGANYETHWAYQPLRRTSPPELDEPDVDAIDRYVIKRLDEHGLRLSPAISRRQWIRRVTFDLTGLPPTWKAIDDFVNDQSNDAYEKVVDSLLTSPRYGERWGRHWLDLARYADTHGGTAIGFVRFPYSYTFRDYVIKAFNDDLPYDQFIVQQVAADQLDLEPNDPALAALGFLTVGMQFRNPHDVIDDQIDVVTRGLMGLTVACARCHDHKYDAIPTSDYYSLYATFASSQAPERLPILGRPPADEAFRKYQKELVKRTVERDDMRRDQTEVMRGRLRMQVGRYLHELADQAAEQDISSAFLSYRTDDLRPVVLDRWRTYVAELPADDPVFGLWKQLEEVASENFATRCNELLQQMKQENGDGSAWANAQTLSNAAPRWNPQLLKEVEEQKPQSLHELADVYGDLFTATHRQWLEALLAASLEASAEGEIVPDQDPRHATINSVVQRQLRRHLNEPGTPTVINDELAETMLNRTVRDSLNGKTGAIDRLNLSDPASPPRAMVLQESEAAGPFHIFRRGDPINRGDTVKARFLSAIPLAEANFPSGQRRLGLARAIVDPDNPLTRRVIVNWVWQHHFGQALVRTPDDFGIRGDLPTHPQLLDYLATIFADDGWSLKALHKRIVLSRTYQQAAVEKTAAREQDPENRLLWRMPRRRLDLEAMRDSMLAVAGELNTSQIGGKPFELLSDPAVPRRTVYAFINRDVVSPLSSTFDGPNASSCTAQRPQTTVPQQTLFALNSAFIQDRASQFAERAETAEKEPSKRITWMYRAAYGRNPDNDELDIALEFLSTLEPAKPVETESVEPDAWQQLAHALLASNEFVFVD